MRFGCLDTDIEDGTDAFVSVSLGDQFDDNLFARRERVTVLGVDTGAPIELIGAVSAAERLVGQEGLDGGE